jgi:hypothetical protein
MYSSSGYNPYRKKGEIANISKTARELAEKHRIIISDVSPNENGNITIAMVRKLIEQKTE